MFTDTGTNLSRIINFYTKQPLNHVSIAFDNELKEVYSFGRTQPKNPFSGGFVRENVQSEFLRDANCAIYSYDISKSEVETILRKIKEIEKVKADYRYNFIGLIGIILQIEIRRKNAYFCSEFVATLLTDTNVITLSKPNCFITAEDIRSEIGMKLVFEGKLSEYESYVNGWDSALNRKSETSEKQSFIFSLSKKVKRFVVR